MAQTYDAHIKLHNGVDWDTLRPKTIANNVAMTDGKSVQAKIDNLSTKLDLNTVQKYDIVTQGGLAIWGAKLCSIKFTKVNEMAYFKIIGSNDYDSNERNHGVYELTIKKHGVLGVKNFSCDFTVLRNANESGGNNKGINNIYLKEIDATNVEVYMEFENVGSTSTVKYESYLVEYSSSDKVAVNMNYARLTVAPTDLSSMSSSEKIESVYKSDIGDKTSLLTNNKTNLVGAINEVNTKASNVKSKRTCRFVIGSSTSGWTENDCDYLCDGTADDVEFNRAIADLPTGGGEIVILDGTYNLGDMVDINKSNVTIRGNGNATILRRAFNAVGSSSLLTIMLRVNASYCTLRDFDIDGNKANYNFGANAGIHYNSANSSMVGIKVYNIHAYNHQRHGISLKGAGLEVSNCYTHGNYIGIDCQCISYSSKIVISNNICVDNTYEGISSYSGAINITGNVVYGNGTGINSATIQDGVISGNAINRNYRGIYATGTGVITGNTVYHSDEYGIVIDSSSATFVITGNAVYRGNGLSADYNNTQQNIYLSQAKNCLVANNLIMGKNYTNSGTNNTFYNNKYN